MGDTCCIKGCENSIVAMGLCVNHWRANKKHGSPVAVRPLSSANRGLTHEARFWKSVRKTDGCWLWEAGCDRDGYGRFAAIIGGVPTRLATRYSYMLHTGEVLDSSVLIMHSCDTPRCVNPGHLSAGTPRENSQDMVRKGRHISGNKQKAHKLSKVTDDQVRDILRDPRRYPEIAKEYGLSYQHIVEIKTRTSRGYVQIDPAEIIHGRRGSKGSERSKNLTENDVLDILARPEGPTELSKVYGVSPATICDIRKGRSWKHVPNVPPDFKEFECKDCSVNTMDIDEYYMVWDPIWQQAGNPNGMLCIGCLEKRLGRELCAKDFSDALINAVSSSNFQSEHLVSRMTQI